MSNRSAAKAGAPYRPGDQFDPGALRRALAGLELHDDPAALARAGRDYFWYSPVLKRQLEGRAPHLVVRPRSVAEVQAVAAACAIHRVPLTVRGGGTGNYGQCVPLHGGVVLDMTAMNRVLELDAARAVVEAGALLHDVDQAARQHGGQLRMWPSTARIATSGAPWWWLRVIGDPGRNLFMKGLRPLYAAGCRMRWLQLHNMNHLSADERSAFLARVRSSLAAL